MKKRQGFVSNSSSSSFVAYIKDMPMDKREELCKLVDTHNDNAGEGYLFVKRDFLLGRMDYHTEENDAICSLVVPYPNTSSD